MSKIENKNKAPYQSFFRNFTNVWISVQNYLTFSFNPFVKLVNNVKFVPSDSSKLLNFNQDHSLQNVVFLLKSL